MTEVLERVITAATLRMAIRAKLRTGVGRRTVSQLILAHVPPNLIAGRDDAGLKRVPVELIPHDRRVAFLDELDQLEDGFPDLDSGFARLAV